MDFLKTLFILVALTARAQAPAPPGPPSAATGTITILLNGQVIGSAPVLNLQAYGLATSGILATAVPNSSLNSIDIVFNANSILVPTFNQIENNPNFCNSTNGTPNCTCMLPYAPLTSYQAGQEFLLSSTTPCSTLSINNIIPPITIMQNNGTTPTTVQFGKIGFDGTYFRTI